MADTLIELRHLTKLFSCDAKALALRLLDPSERLQLMERHRHELALLDVSLDIRRGGIQVVMGLSGSGKSTLVRHINRLVEPTSGEVRIDGENILALSQPALRELRRRRLSMVFQRFALLPHRTVAQNVAYGLRSAGASRQAQRSAAEDWIERVGLAGTGHLYPAQLSGGMQQRVGLARALATEADILLMDEAFSALDPLIRHDMQDLLLTLQRDLGRTIVFVTHDPDEAMRLGDRIAILKDGELVQDGSRQDLLLHPANDYVDAFLAQVDRGKVINVAAVMEPCNALEVSSEMSIGCEVTIAQAARRMAEAEISQAVVTDDVDTVIGHVSLARLVGMSSRLPEYRGRPA